MFVEINVSSSKCSELKINNWTMKFIYVDILHSYSNWK